MMATITEPGTAYERGWQAGYDDTLAGVQIPGRHRVHELPPLPRDPDYATGYGNGVADAMRSIRASVLIPGSAPFRRH